MSVSYTRALASFPAGLNPDRFTQEIRDSAAILIALDYLQIEPPDVQIWFKASLTSPEVSALDALIAAHSGLPLPDAALQVFITDESDKTITGAVVYDRANGGSLSIPAGSSFPVTPVAGELFWRTDTNALYRRNAGNTSWDQVAASVAGADHGALAGLGDDDHTQYQLRSEKGAANGYAGLQAGGDISDATHGSRGGGALHASATTSVAGFLSAADKTKLDGVAAGATNTPLTSSAPVNVTKAAAAVGVATSAARADHKHDITTAAPAVGIGGGNSEGSAASLARSDHGHALRETGGPSDLTIGAIADGQLVKRVGSALVGVSGAGAGVLAQTQAAQVVADASTTSTSFVDLLTVNITTEANAVIIRAMGHVSNSSANVNMRLRVLVDGVSVGGGQVRSASASGIAVPFALQFKTGVLSAGAHVIKLQWATVSSTMRCRPVAAADSETASLVVEEVTG